MPINLHEIQRRFGFHKPRSLGTENALDTIRQGCAQLADLIIQETPECREQSNALTRLEEVMFHAVAARVRPTAERGTPVSRVDAAVAASTPAKRAPSLADLEAETVRDARQPVKLDGSADYATGGEGPST